MSAYDGANGPKRTKRPFVIEGEQIVPIRGNQQMKRIAKTAAIGLTVAALSGAGAIVVQASGGEHGKAVSEIAKAADFASGRAHGAAVSAEAKQWGAIRSAEARAKGAAHAAAGKAKGHDASEPGRLKSEAARS